MKSRTLLLIITTVVLVGSIIVVCQGMFNSHISSDIEWAKKNNESLISGLATMKRFEQKVSSDSLIIATLTANLRFSEYKRLELERSNAKLADLVKGLKGERRALQAVVDSCLKKN